MHVEAAWIPLCVAAGGLLLKGVQLGAAIARRKRSPDSDPHVIRSAFDSHLADDRETHATIVGKLDVIGVRIDALCEGVDDLRARKGR